MTKYFHKGRSHEQNFYGDEHFRTFTYYKLLFCHIKHESEKKISTSS